MSELITVQIPRALERYGAGSRRFAVAAATVREAIGELPPDLRSRVLKADGGVYPHLLVFVNELAATPDDVLNGGELVEIVAAVEGG